MAEIKELSWWERVRRFGGVLMLIRFSLLLALIGLGVVATDQGHEVLRAMGESFDWVQAFWLFIATIICAFSVWYCARVLYLFRFATPASRRDIFPRLKKHLPRWLGAAVILFVAGSLIITAPNLFNIVLAIILFIAAGFFLYFVYHRRELLNRTGLLTLSGYEQEPKDLTSWWQLPRLTRVIIALLLLINIVLFFIFKHYAGGFAASLGTPAIVLIAAATLIPMGSFLVYLGNRYRFPSVALVLILAVIFSLFNDNHWVRLYPGMNTYEPPEALPHDPAWVRPLATYHSLEDYFQAWIRDLQVYRKKNSGYRQEPPIPVFIVAAEAGGIRAAYWTASVLAELQDRARDQDLNFARHLFAISAVSGGSLGGTMFAALLNAPAEQARSGCQPESHLRCRAQRLLSQDFLAPTVAAFLFPDLVQRFLPQPLLNDRGLALEESWEAGWDEFEAGEWFRRRFETLWENDPFATPLLLLNGTVVETGQRLIINPLGFDSENFHRTFSDALDSAAAMGSEIPLSTAAHLSARFTYVSPAGTIRRRDLTDSEKQWIRVVDGGYFENSGAVTADEILLAVQQKAEALKIAIWPVVIHISNSPVRPAEQSGGLPGRRMLMGEVLSPVRALLHTRPARGYQARDELRRRLVSSNPPKGSHVHFGLCQYAVTLPLGWDLSEAAQQDMTFQLIGYPDYPQRRDNSANLEQILRLLQGDEDRGVRYEPIGVNCTPLEGR